MVRIFQELCFVQKQIYNKIDIHSHAQDFVNAIVKQLQL